MYLFFCDESFGLSGDWCILVELLSNPLKRCFSPFKLVCIVKRGAKIIAYLFRALASSSSPLWNARWVFMHGNYTAAIHVGGRSFNAGCLLCDIVIDRVDIEGIDSPFSRTDTETAAITQHSQGTLFGHWNQMVQVSVIVYPLYPWWILPSSLHCSSILSHFRTVRLWRGVVLTVYCAIIRQFCLRDLS